MKYDIHFKKKSLGYDRRQSPRNCFAAIVRPMPSTTTNLRPRLRPQHPHHQQTMTTMTTTTTERMTQQQMLTTMMMIPRHRQQSAARRPQC
jgi:hypothetical protein